MKLLSYIITAIIIIVVLVFTIMVKQIVPENQFEPYRLELDSVWDKDADSQEYVMDLDNDSKLEIIRHQKINKAGHSLELWNDKHLKMLDVFDKNEFVISLSLKFADANEDGLKEIIFLTANKQLAYLNILEYKYDHKGVSFLKGIKKIKVDSIKYYNNKPDAINHNILINKNDIWFNIQAAYSLQPRNIYKYNSSTQELVKTPRNSIVAKAFELVSYNNQDFLLAKNVIAAGNTVSPEESEMLRNAKDPDSIGYYELTKNRVYQYGDFSSYILMYNSSLDFAFKPIEFNGWANYTKTGIVTLDSIPCIVAITNTIQGDTTNKKITICNLQGKILKQRPMTDSYSEVFSEKNKIVFWGNNTFNVYSEMLEPIKEIPDITYACGFYDIGNRKETEFIAFKKNKICILSDDFKALATFKIEQEYAPYPEDNGIELLQIDKKQCFVYNTHSFYYLFSYQKNEFALLKYPFYISIFFLWFGILFLILRINTMRLEKEKRKLEKTVAERTQELQNINMELASQNEEIEAQTEKIIEQYQRIEKLDRFKESLTQALVHDLKNPLSQILLNAGNHEVNNPARKMMRLIMNMLDVEKYENTELKLNIELHSLRNILEEVKTGHEISLREKNLGLHFHFDDYLVLADKEIVVRVFDNLLANAIRFSPQNRDIDVLAENSGDDIIQISIINSGKPIPEEALPYIFDKYRQIGKRDSSSSQSTGLGLSFCKMALEAHGHKISAQNIKDSVLFTFTLNGKRNQGQEQSKEEYDREIVLTQDEKTLLKPFFDCLKNFEVHQVSDILQVLDEISGESENIKAIKLLIRDAAFAANAELYLQIIHK